MTQSTTRLVSAIGMMGSDQAGEASNALAMATRLLAAQGLTWRDVAERAFPAGQPAGSQPIDPSPSAASPFADIFGGFARDAFDPSRWGGPRPGKSFHKTQTKRFRTRIEGVDVPETISGTISLVDADRRSRSGPMLVLDIVGDTFTYGPLVCFSEALQADLRRAVDTGEVVIARIRPPRAAGHMPTVVGMGVRPARSPSREEVPA